MAYYVYILECSNDALYTGFTTNLERRYKEHTIGSFKCKYTRSFPPKQMVASWALDLDLAGVLRFEQKIKQMTREAKWALVNAPEKAKDMIAAIYQAEEAGEKIWPVDTLATA